MTFNLLEPPVLLSFVSLLLDLVLNDSLAWCTESRPNNILAFHIRVCFLALANHGPKLLLL